MNYFGKTMFDTVIRDLQIVEAAVKNWADDFSGAILKFNHVKLHNWFDLNYLFITVCMSRCVIKG